MEEASHVTHRCWWRSEALVVEFGQTGILDFGPPPQEPDHPMHRLLLVLSMSLLVTACASPSPVVRPTPEPSPELMAEEPVSVAEEEAASEPTTEASPGDEAPGDATQPPPAAPIPGPDRSAESLVNPSGIPLGRNPLAQVNPSGPPPVTSSALSAETRAVAVPFLQAVLKRDLTAAREYFPPGARPDSWSSVIPAEAMTGTTSDFSECAGSEPATSDMPESSSSYAIMFRFPRDCARVPVMASAVPDETLQRFNGVGVRLVKVDNRWWVTGISAFRAVS